MRIDIATLFTELCDTVNNESIVGRAQKAGKIEIYSHLIRDYAFNKHNRVDDCPYGGGMGMLLQANPIYECYADVVRGQGRRPHVIFMSPQGKTFTQQKAVELSKRDWLFIICGHYEGVDQRVLDEIVDEEISIGDYVLTGGELGALVVTDAVARLCEGVLADEACFTEESHWNGLLEYPHYTRPPVWHGRAIPDVLTTGHHKNIQQWRREKALENTFFKRPDMLEHAELTKQDQAYLEKLGQGRENPAPVMTGQEGTTMDYRFLKEYGDTYREQAANLIHYCFSGWKRENVLKMWDNLDDSTVIIGGVDDGDVLASALLVNRYEMYVNGKKAAMGGIGAVSTLGAMRMKGACAGCLKTALRYMYDNQFRYSALAPFSYEFYRKFGWEWGFEFVEYQIPMEKCKGFSVQGGTFEHIWNKEDWKKVAPVYEKQIAQYNGGISRTETMWKSKLDFTESDKQCVLYRDSAGEGKGYVLFHYNEGSLFVDEYFWEDAHALQSLLAFLYLHNGQADKINIRDYRDGVLLDLLPSKYIDIKYHPHMMIRVIRAEDALAQYPYTQDGELCIAVEDPVLEENNAVFSILVSGGKAKVVERIQRKPDAVFDIQSFSQMMFGFRSLPQLRKAGKVPVCAEHVEAYFQPSCLTGIRDYF